jgi:hypothetical protein
MCEYGNIKTRRLLDQQGSGVSDEREVMDFELVATLMQTHFDLISL